MAEPQPNPPEETPKRSPHSRADWVVGAEEGVDAEHQRANSGEYQTMPRPKLVRPDRPADAPEGLERPPVPSVGQRGGAQVPMTAVPGNLERASLPKWDAGRSSVPMPHIERGEIFARATPAPEQAREFPMDDAEERAQVAAQVAQERAEAAAVAARPHEVVAPKEFEIPTFEAPWYMRLPEIVGTNRAVQLLLVLVAVGIGAFLFWPREEKTMSIGHLKAQAERYADTQVRVNGRVAEVWPVGGSYAYTLVQGRDTIVVFTRWHQPRRQDRLTVIGTLSNGFLDGQSRVAIFEAAK